jgi:hypothetical protein
LARLGKLLHLQDKILNGPYRLILIQIQEAHSNKWPTGMIDHPTIQHTFEERVNRAQQFVKDYTIPFEVYIDPWGDPFENTFQSWPDKYYMIDMKNKTIMDKSQYNYGAAVINDYSILLQKAL